MPLEKDHNLAVVASIKKWLAPFCSSRDSASDDISVIVSKKMAARMEKGEVFFDETKKTSASLHNQRLL